MLGGKSNMKKRLLSVLMCLCMMLTMVPAAFATGESTDAEGSDSSSSTISAETTTLASGTYTLSDDVTLTSGALTVPSGVDVTLDLNGHKLTNKSGEDTIVVQFGGKLTIEGTGTVDNVSHQKTAIYNSGTVVLNGGTYDRSAENGTDAETSGQNSFYTILNHGTMTINDGVTVTTAGGGNNLATKGRFSSLIDNGYYSYNGTNPRNSYVADSNAAAPSLTINGGTFAGGLNTIKNDDGSNLTINNGTFSNFYQALVQNHNIAEITGGTFTAASDASGTIYGVDNCGCAAETDIGTLTISGGTFSGVKYGVWDRSSQPAQVTITGGSFTATTAAVAVNDGSNAEIAITGGTFSSDVGTYCATGYDCQQSEDGKYVVGISTGAQVETNTDANGNVTATVDGNYSGAESSEGEDDGGISTEAGKVTIDVANDGETTTGTKAEITVGSNALTSINANTSVEEVELKTNVGTLTISDAAWNDMTAKATNEDKTASVVIKLENKSTEDSNPIYEVTATVGSGEDAVNAFDGTGTGSVTISVPYTAVEGKANVKVYCTDDGKMEDMDAVLSDEILSWTTSHFSTFEVVAYGEDDEVTYQTTSEEGTSVSSGSFSEALNAVANTGGTITLLKDVTWNAETAFTTSKAVTIQGSHKIDVTVALSNDTSIKTAFVIQQNGSITLDGVTMNVTTAEGNEQNTGRNAAFSITSDAKLALVNGAKLTLNGLQSGMIMPGTAPVSAAVSVSGEGSAITASTIRGNFSNGGQFEIKDGASLAIDGCGSHGLSANKVTVDNASVTVKKTGLCGIITTDSNSSVELKNGATVTVENCANDTDTNNRAAVDLSTSNASMTVDGTSTLTVSGTSERSKVALSSTATNDINGSIIGTVTQGEKSTTYYEVTFNVTPSDATIVVKDSDGNEVNAVNGKYALEKDKTYTYTVSKSGYRTQTGTFTVTEAETISVTLSSSGGGGGGGGSSSSAYSITVDKATGGTVKVSPTSASKGSTVTITVTPDNGYELDNLTVTDKDGKVVSLTDKGDGKYTFTMPASKVTVKASFVETGTEPETPVFTDVSTSAYYYDAVLWAVENGVTNGTSANTFSPDMDCTRAQMVTFLWRAAGAPEPTTATNPFTDVSSSAYYYDAVLWAVEEGITSGTSATTFSPDVTCTRAQTVTFLYRANGSPAVSGSNPFSDVAADAYYAAAVQWAVTQGVTTGVSATTFAPDTACTRGQIVTFLYRDMA